MTKLKGALPLESEDDVIKLAEHILEKISECLETGKPATVIIGSEKKCVMINIDLRHGAGH